MNERFRIRTTLILTNFKKNNSHLFWVPEDIDDYDRLGEVDSYTKKRYFNKNDTDLIIDIMIWHLKMMDEDFVEKQIFGTNIDDDDYDYQNRTMDDILRITIVAQHNEYAFMELFCLFYDSLWY